MMSFPVPKPAGTSVILNAPPAPISTSLPNQFGVSISAPVSVVPTHCKLINTFAFSRLTEPTRVPSIVIVLLIGISASVKVFDPLAVPVYTLLCSYHGFFAISSKTDPDARRRSNIPPEFVFVQNTCFVAVSRSSIKASWSGFVVPV